ncbi:hypothetical protein [Pleurocapsa sp. PCC 7319]|uniref:hypothetical protein n=1 Tax=Pleurocapsa sp. PCC 7319 TaxID=118161 RepID=UPI00034C19FE|nr:hypothetical protein [Pleurocapsa sp. PCC 7319]
MSYIAKLPSFLSTNESKIWWLLRLGVCLEFIGHGAFGVITKAGWLPYFAVWGIPENLAWRIMPIVGVMDIVLGILALFAPRKALLLFMAAWGLMTACLRPLAGEPVSELLERSYNYCVPLVAFLMITWDVKQHGWFHRVKNLPTLTREHWRWLKILLQVAIAVYLIGHGAFGAFDAKAGLAKQYDVTGISALFGSTEAALTVIGWFEIVLGIAVLFAPVAYLLFFVCGWKIATESLFIFSGAFFGWFEFIERGAGMVAPLALYFIIRVLKYSVNSRGVQQFVRE